MKNNNIIIFLIIFIVSITNLYGQKRGLAKENASKSSIDSIWNKVESAIYYSYYTPSYMSTVNSTYTVLKVDINKRGKVTDIKFSDSADSIFVNAFLKKSIKYDTKSTFEKYAKLKSYTNVSLLIPVSFEPNYPYQKKLFSYDALDSILKYNKISFTGKSILFPLINITVLPSGNM